MEDLGIGWSFYHKQLGKVVAGLCEVHVKKKMDASAIAPIISILEKALEKTKEKEGDLRDFPVYDVVYDIAEQAGNEVEVDANLQAYGMNSFGEGCFDPNFVFSRFLDKEWKYFTYGVDGGVGELTKFLLD